MSNSTVGPSTKHLRSEVRRIIETNNREIPDEITTTMTQTALEKSLVDLDELTQQEYDEMIVDTKERLNDILQEVRDGS